jgi:hypothetical protein
VLIRGFRSAQRVRPVLGIDLGSVHAKRALYCARVRREHALPSRHMLVCQVDAQLVVPVGRPSSSLLDSAMKQDQGRAGSGASIDAVFSATVDGAGRPRILCFRGTNRAQRPRPAPEAPRAVAFRMAGARLLERCAHHGCVGFTRPIPTLLSSCNSIPTVLIPPCLTARSSTRQGGRSTERPEPIVNYGWA